MRQTRPIAAEFIGTALLTAATFGSTMMGSQLQAGQSFGLFITSLMCGATLFVLITILAPVSGGHINPAVTLTFALRREIAPAQAFGFVLAQTLGAVAGAMIAHLMFGAPALEPSTIPRAAPQLWLSEAIATAGLIFVIIGGLAAKAPVPALVGAFATTGYWFTASSGFTNPAVTVARTLTGSAAGLRPEDLAAYIAAQLLGAVAGFALATWLFAKEKPPA